MTPLTVKVQKTLEWMAERGMLPTSFEAIAKLVRERYRIGCTPPAARKAVDRLAARGIAAREPGKFRTVRMLNQ